MEVINLTGEEDDAPSTEFNPHKRAKRDAARVAWRFTWHCSALDPNGVSSADLLFTTMEAMMDEWDGVEYAFAGRETCPSTGSKHLQGFVKLAKKQRLSYLKRFHATISWHPADASWEDNYMYCTKEDKHPHVVGELPEFKNNGAREKSRWENAWDNAVAGQIDNIDKDILLRTYASVKMVARDHAKKPPSLEDYNAEWIYGKSGSGKSTLARQENPDYYPKEANKWWCSYQGEHCALIEDLDPDCCKYLARYIKVWTDKFPFTAEVKASSGLIRPQKIVITSQYTIEECFNERDAVAIRRRCRVRKIEAFEEVPDDSAPNAESAPGTAGTFYQATQPTQVLADMEEDYKEECRDIRHGVEGCL